MQAILSSPGSFQVDFHSVSSRTLSESADDVGFLWPKEVRQLPGPARSFNLKSNMAARLSDMASSVSLCDQALLWRCHFFYTLQVLLADESSFGLIGNDGTSSNSNSLSAIYMNLML